jgi:hypothetical protein
MMLTLGVLTLLVKTIFASRETATMCVRSSPVPMTQSMA